MSDSAKEEFFDDLKKRGLPHVFFQREIFGDFIFQLIKSH
jgi:hypothetical protein